MQTGQKGFTLIESLLVLSIFMIISSITVFSLKPQQMFMNKDQFFGQLSADLLYGQQYAISHQTDVTFYFTLNQKKYSLYTRTDLPPLIEREYPESITVYGGSLPLSFKFLADGNISKFGTFYIIDNGKRYRFTLLIGRGRFNICEDK